MVGRTAVEVSYRNAKRVVAIALMVVAIFILMMLIERSYFQSQFNAAFDDMVSISKSSGRVQLADEQLSMAAHMMAATGDVEWLHQYNIAANEMAGNIGTIRDLAPESTNTITDGAAKIRNRLSEFDEYAFQLVESGQLQSASNILGSNEYNSYRTKLAETIKELMNTSRIDIQRRLHNLASQTRVVYFGSLILIVVGVVFLWQQLINGLEHSRNYFKDRESEIQRLAMNDSLTGLANRFYFRDRTCELLREADLDNDLVALFIIDLDRFKPINDLFGHGIGDRVLIEIGERLKATTRRSDCCARYGGDEFVVTCKFGGDTAAFVAMGQRIITNLSEPIVLDDLQLQVGACIGIAISPLDAVDFDDLIRKADIALYEAKGSGRGCVRVFDKQMDENLKQQRVMQSDLRDVINDGQIIPFFQPIVDLTSTEPISLEILARWNHPKEGILPPSAFIQDVIDLDLIDEMTLLLLEEACRHVSKFSDDVCISLNVAAKQLQNAWMVEQIISVLDKTHFPASRLKIEITETALISDLEQTSRLLASWKDRGIRIVIDDFGTGYSSLTYLAHLPFDELKIDQSFVRQMNSSDECMKIVSSIIALGLNMGLDIVAEGIEEQWQADLLLRQGCRRGQGYLYSKPVPAAKLDSLLAA